MDDVKKREKTSYQIQTGEKLKERYEILNVLGEGGFGITYQGYDEVLATTVVIKEFYPDGLVHRNVTTQGDSVVHTYEGADKHSFEKGLHNFLMEARTLAQFDRLEGVVSVKDFFKENGTAYIVMEYLDGMSVKQYVKKYGPIPYEIMLAKMRRIFAALDILHKHDIIHRDLSADNIMMMPDGNMKLIDFGSARQFENDRKTKTITVMFKRGYAAEEQYRVKGKQGPWTDVYGISATMYYMLSGVVPDESVERVIHDYVKPLTECKAQEIPAKISLAIEAGMAVKAEERIQNIGELYRHLYGKALSENENAGKQYIQQKHMAVKEDVLKDEEEHSKSDEDISNVDSEKLTYTGMKRQLAREIQERVQRKKHTVFWLYIRKWRAVLCVIFICCLIGIFGGFLLKERKATDLAGKNSVMAGQFAEQVAPKKENENTPEPTEANWTYSPVPTRKNALDNDASRQIMPYFVNKEYKSVKKKLKQFSSFHVKIKYVYDDLVESGKIISQSPDRGIELKSDQKIKIIVSKGKKEIPKVTKKPQNSIDKSENKTTIVSKGNERDSKREEISKTVKKPQNNVEKSDKKEKIVSKKDEKGTESKEASKATKKPKTKEDKSEKIDGSLDSLFE